MGKQSDSLKALQDGHKAVELYPSAPAYTVLAMTQEILRAHDDALETIEKAIDTAGRGYNPEEAKAMKERLEKVTGGDKKKKEEEEAKQKAEEEAKKKKQAEEEAKKKKEEEAKKKKAALEAKKKKELEAKKKAEEEAKRKAEEEAKQEEEARL